jgi:hypothetical protein
VTDGRDERLERLYAQAERKNEARKAATVRRGPIGLIAVCLGVALVVGITAAIDLRRLHTPEGTALAWTGAAVFGDCVAYRELTVGLTDDDRDDGEQCRDLRRLTEDARDRPGDVEIEVLEAEEDGDRARAVVRVRRPGVDGDVDVPIEMRPRRSGWQVERADATCAALPCP